MLSLKNLEYTLKQSQQACLILDAQTTSFKVVHANATFLTYFGIHSPEINSKSFFKIFDHDAAEQPALCEVEFSTFFHLVIQTRTTQELLLNAGRLAGYKLEVHPVFTIDDQISYLILSIYDLSKSDLFPLSPLFTNYPDAILTLDLEGRIISFNKVLAELAECDENVLMKLDFIPFIIPEDLEMVLAYAKQAINGDIQNFDTGIVTAKGNRRNINVTFLPLMVGEKVNSIYLIIKNITPLKEAETRLEVYHKQIEEILESITDGFFAINESWEITYWNKQAEKMLGRPRSELIGNNLWEMFPEAVSLKFYENYRRAMEERISLTFEEYFYIAEIWFEVCVYPSPNGITVYFKDITQQRNSYGLLSEAKEKYQQLFDLNPMPIVVYEMKNYEILAVNQAMIDSYGFSREEFLSMNLRQLRAEEDIQQFESMMVNEVMQGGRHQVLTKHLKKSGKVIDVEVKGNEIEFNGISARIALAMDVTEKLAMERQKRHDEKILRDTVERFQILSKATSDAIFDLDVKANVLFWGEGYKQLFGYEPKDNYGLNNWTELAHADDAARISKLRSICIQNKEVRVQYEYRFRCADGSYKFVLAKEFLVYSPEGELLRTIGSVQDITDRVTYIQALERTNKRLKDISWMQSHVVRAPLARLMGLAELLSADKLDPEQSDLLSKLMESASELDQVIKEIVKKAENI